MESFGKLCGSVLWTDQSLMEFYGFEIFSHAIDETNIFHDKILSRLF